MYVSHDPHLTIMAVGSGSTTTRFGARVTGLAPSVKLIDIALTMGASPSNETAGSSLMFTMVTLEWKNKTVLMSSLSA